MKKYLLLSSSVILLLLAVLILRPVPITTEGHCLLVEGTIVNLQEGGVKDVVIRLKESDKTFYINRGLEQDLDLETLREKLMYQKVSIYYPKYWTPLDPSNSTRHIAKLSHKKEMIFNEMK